MMWRALFLAAMLSLFGAVSVVAAPPKKQPADTYLRLQQVKVVDQHAFGQPMEAASLLLPKGWKVESSVRWTGDIGCPENGVQLALKARSPDGRLGFEVFPTYVWKWSDDPMVVQHAQQATNPFGIRGCDYLPPYDAADYLQNIFLPRWRTGSHLNDLGHVPDLAQARLLEYQAVAAGGPAMPQPEFDVALAVVETPRNGGADEEWVLVTVMRTVMPMPTLGAMWGGGYPQMANSYHLTALSQFAARAPKGQLEQNERLFEVIYRSFRVNPKWDAGVAMFFQNVAATQRKGVADRARIISESIRETGDIIRQAYATRQASQDRTLARQTQALRGVETWIDPATQSRIELSSGYRGAWSNGLGDYILSDTPGFNPSQALGGNWTALKPDNR